MRADRLEPVDAVAGAVHLEAGPRQGDGHQVERGTVVLDEHDDGAASGARAGPSSPAGTAASGTEKPNVLPAPTSLSSHIRPPNSSTIRRRQRQPQAGALLARRRPGRPAGRTRRCAPGRLGATPMPVSATVTTSSPSSRRGPDQRRCPPSGVNFTALRQQVDDDLLEAQLVGLDAPTSSVARRASSSMPCGAARSRTIETPYSGRARTENLGELQLHPAGLDLRQVEDLVEQLEQVLARAPDVARGTPPAAR